MLRGGVIPSVFINTGLEFPEIRQFVQAQKDVVIIKPKLTFKEVIERYGWPVVSKEQASYIYAYRHTSDPKWKAYRLNGDAKGRFKISKKWQYLVDAPFEISHKCCDVLKKAPAYAYEKETGKHPIIATLAAESMLRTSNWLQYGCNAFDAKRPNSRPLSVWTEQDILQYIQRYNVPIASIYGSIETLDDGTLHLTGEQRTGCAFCAFGVHLDKEPNKFQRMHQTHPNLWNFCINELGEGKVLDYINVKYE